MKIKITKANSDKIEAALAAVNGKASAHCYTRAREIEDLAAEVEAQLERLGLPKANRAGAVAHAESGSTVANSYDYSRKGTAVRLERNTAGWNLICVWTTTLYKSPAPVRLTLTADQDAKLVEVLRRNYTVGQQSSAA